MNARRRHGFTAIETLLAASITVLLAAGAYAIGLRGLRASWAATQAGLDALL